MVSLPASGETSAFILPRRTPESSPIICACHAQHVQQVVELDKLRGQIAVCTAEIEREQESKRMLVTSYSRPQNSKNQYEKVVSALSSPLRVSSPIYGKNDPRELASASRALLRSQSRARSPVPKTEQTLLQLSPRQKFTFSTSMPELPTILNIGVQPQ